MHLLHLQYVLNWTLWLHCSWELIIKSLATHPAIWSVFGFKQTINSSSAWSQSNQHKSVLSGDHTGFILNKCEWRLMRGNCWLIIMCIAKWKKRHLQPPLFSPGESHWMMSLIRCLKKLDSPWWLFAFKWQIILANIWITSPLKSYYPCCSCMGTQIAPHPSHYKLELTENKKNSFLECLRKAICCINVTSISLQNQWLQLEKPDLLLC